jgi:hypothetical protein
VVGSELTLQDFFDTACEFRPVEDIDERPLDCGHTHCHTLPIHGRGQVVRLAGRHQRLRRSDETAGAERQLHQFCPSGTEYAMHAVTAVLREPFWSVRCRASMKLLATAVERAAHRCVPGKPAIQLNS